MLPPFTLKFDRTEGAALSGAARRARFIGNVVFTMGDLRLRADEMVFDPAAFSLEATGNVVLTRGDEVLRGDRFFLSSDESTFQADKGQVVSPPILYFPVNPSRRNPVKFMQPMPALLLTPKARASCSFAPPMFSYKVKAARL